MPHTETFSTDDFVAAFGADESEGGVIAAEAKKYEFRYRRLDSKERDQVILDILKKIDGFTKVGAHRSDIWERCWADANDNFANNDGAIEALDPVFMGAHPIVRLGGDYARPENPNFETYWFRVLRHWLFDRYLKNSETVLEFGCGSGFNLAKAAEMFPDKHFVGLDWSESSVELVNRIADRHDFDLKGRRFDFFNPDSDFDLRPGSAIMTFAALEQTGSKFIDFAEWLLARRPKLVLSMEPIIEFYDENHLVDYVATRYHRHRDYLNGYYGWVKDKADQGAVEILNARRLGFGSLYHEGYSLVIWRPT